MDKKLLIVVMLLLVGGAAAYAYTPNIAGGAEATFDGTAKGVTWIVGFDPSCDYVVDGSDDQVEINSAIEHASKGDKILLREGCF